MSANGFASGPKIHTHGPAGPEPPRPKSWQAGGFDGSVVLDWDDLRYEPLSERTSKVHRQDLGQPVSPDSSFEDWLDGLPRLLGASGLKRLRDAIVRAREGDRPVIAALGGHVIKTGCAPYLIDWIHREILNGLALNGAAAIHDLELAVAGKTSEDVGPRLMDGTFGFARETSELFATASTRAVQQSVGLVLPWAMSSSITAARAWMSLCSRPPNAPVFP